ncbi:MAG: protein-L-isoaspartate(D-aspartate) O-methyltransferase [Candidatus Humimicrobiaceae bacterium]
MVNNRNFKNLRKQMVETQLISRGISDPKVLEAMAKVPREKFVPENKKSQAYYDGPIPIGSGQTISQPYIVAYMTELLELGGREKVLEIGTGSCYQTAILAEIAKEVYSVEIIEEFYSKAQKLLKDYPNINLANKNGYYGWEEHAPYNRIIATAAPKKIPQPLIEQLSNGGIMVIPVGPTGFNQTLYKVTKKNNKIARKPICGVAFVPLKKNF